jgi:hypothetical protein
MRDAISHDSDQPTTWPTTWLARKAGRGVALGFLIFAFALPLLSGVVGRAIKGKQVYNGEEFETVLCAGDLASAAQSMYPPPDAFSCEGLATKASYVYLPALAEGVRWLEGVTGREAVVAGYAVMYFAALAFLLGAVFFSPMARVAVAERVPFLGLITGSVAQWGNVAAPAYALLLGAALLVPWGGGLGMAVFVMALAGLSSVKQVWLCALAICLLAPLAWWQRWVWFLGGAALGLAPTLWFLAHGGSEAVAWRELLSHFAFVDRPGQGFLGWVGVFGVETASLLSGGLWLVFAGAIVLGALGLAERHRLSVWERVWLGLLVAGLLNPRLLAYEFFLLAPGAVIAMKAGMSAGVRWLEPVLFGACGLTLLMNVGDLGDYAMMPTTLACAVMVVVAGLPHAPQGLRALLPQVAARAPRPA